MRYCPNPACPHREATGLPAELRDGVERCPDCGAPTVPEPPVPDGGSPGERAGAGPPVTVAECDTLDEAILVRGLLEAEGIPAVIPGEGARGVFGIPRSLPPFGRIAIQVPGPLAEAADAILARLEEEARDG